MCEVVGTELCFKAVFCCPSGVDITPALAMKMLRVFDCERKFLAKTRTLTSELSSSYRRWSRSELARSPSAVFAFSRS
jgi:hypothetical protein